MKWIKSHMRSVGLAMIASIASFMFWFIQPQDTVPSWWFALAISLCAVLSL